METPGLAERTQRLTLKLDNYDEMFTREVVSARRKLEFTRVKRSTEQGRHVFASPGVESRTVR